ncbi:MAG: UDP-glucose 4-epimerase GalE [Pirellulales bacterium]
MKILVTGGAGYVGSHAVRWLEKAGHEVWVYDNLSLGHRAAIRPEQLIEGNLADEARLRAALVDRRIEAVMHFAAFIQVGESVIDPARYYGNNLTGTLALLDTMRRADVRKFVFSSTAAVYGEPTENPITEDSPCLPVNPYGFTKLAIERALADYAHAYGMGYAALRYFNASGASADATIGEDHQPETHLIPLVLQVALGQREAIRIFGNDYPTPDGTCVRDYIHVDDLAAAHAKALEQLKLGTGMSLNLGTGQGHSVQEVIATCRQVTGHAIPTIIEPRRAGDAPALVANANRARQQLGWTPQHADLQDIVSSAWRWHSRHPRGYDDRTRT